MLRDFDSCQILKAATVPEHSVHFMSAVSGGAPFVQDGFLCFAAEDWLTIIGYPLTHVDQRPANQPSAHSPESFHTSFLEAAQKAVQRCQARQCFAIAPHMPPSLQSHVQERDVFYTLDANAPIPASLRRPVAKAMQNLRIEVGQDFSPEHRRLWTEFLGRAAQADTPPMSPMVKRLFLTTPKILQPPDTQLCLLNAWDKEGHLVATLLLDMAPEAFCAYLLGAHSRTYYAPHAADALFARMLSLAQEAGKSFIHLGLGVHEGIARFKRKWGGKPSLSFEMASWNIGDMGNAGDVESGEHALPFASSTQSNNFAADMRDLFSALIVPPSEKQKSAHAAESVEDMRAFLGKSKRQILASMPEQRPHAMLWKVQKGDKISWIGGSAHFFCYSFERAFRELFEQVDAVLFEGPLDAEALRVVKAAGKTLTPEQQPLLPLLQEEEICRLERVVRGPQGRLARLLNMQAQRPVDVRWYLAHARPWAALFTLWTGFLERKGWQQSVDLEAWNLAHAMDKHVVAMESLEEQLASLDSVPPERVVRYFQNCHQWKHKMRKNVQAYLRGDLLGQMGTSAEFPTRTHTIINVRDERFRRRMRPFLEQGRAAVFVGTAHMLNLRLMLAEDGFTLTQVQPTLSHKIRHWFSHEK